MNQDQLEFLFIRHGQTSWNIDGRLNSHTDIGLTNLGKKNISDSLYKFVNRKINRIICSPLIRARETAQIISNRLGVAFTIDERLREVNFGVFEGSTPNEILFSDLATEFIRWRDENEFYVPEGVESYESVNNRAKSFLEEYKSSNEKIIVVSHGVFLRMLLCHNILGLPLNHYRKLKIDNGGLSIVTKLWNDTFRLTNLNV